jgi:hypothetical protein
VIEADQWRDREHDDEREQHRDAGRTGADQAGQGEAEADPATDPGDAINCAHAKDGDDEQEAEEEANDLFVHDAALEDNRRRQRHQRGSSERTQIPEQVADGPDERDQADSE